MESMQLPSAMAQMAQNGHAHQNMQPKVPPRWMKRPCGASFGFGGKYVWLMTLRVELTYR